MKELGKNLGRVGREIDLVPSHVQQPNNILHHQSVLLEAPR